MGRSTTELQALAAQQQLRPQTTAPQGQSHLHSGSPTTADPHLGIRGIVEPPLQPGEERLKRLHRLHRTAGR